MTTIPSQASVAARLFAMLLPLLFAAGCAGGEAGELDGDPARGKAAIRAYGCGSCHAIPGIRSANGRVGPPLDRIGKRAYLGGVLPNTPEHMMRWIRAPEAVDPLTAMPNMGVSESDARNITAYLYTLK
jgi:cytochrome c